MIISSLYFFLLCYSHKSRTNLKNSVHFGICCSWQFQNTPYMSNLTKFWRKYLRLKTTDTIPNIDYWMFQPWQMKKTTSTPSLLYSTHHNILAYSSTPSTTTTSWKKMNRATSQLILSLQTTVKTSTSRRIFHMIFMYFLIYNHLMWFVISRLLYRLIIVP